MVSETTKVPFLWNFVIGEFHNYRTLDRDEKVTALERELRKELDQPTGGIFAAYAELMVFTVNLEFRWQQHRAQMPGNIVSLETFWNMHATGHSKVDCYRYYAANVNSLVMFGTTPQAKTRVRGWREALLAEALKPWSPPVEWLLLEEMTPEQRQDPLSSSGTKPFGTD